MDDVSQTLATAALLVGAFLFGTVIGAKYATKDLCPQVEAPSGE